MSNMDTDNVLDHAKILDELDKRAQAAELQKTLLGSSGNGGLDVYDAAIARIDLLLAQVKAMGGES